VRGISAMNRLAPSKSRSAAAIPQAQLQMQLLPERILRLPQVCQMTGLRRSMIYQLQAEDRFPHRIKLGARAVGWLEHEVQEWLAQRIRLSRPPASAED
jgi:prophage regulatory protein